MFQFVLNLLYRVFSFQLSFHCTLLALFKHTFPHWLHSCLSLWRMALFRLTFPHIGFTLAGLATSWTCFIPPSHGLAISHITMYTSSYFSLDSTFHSTSSTLVYSLSLNFQRMSPSLTTTINRGIQVVNEIFGEINILICN